MRRAIHLAAGAQVACKDLIPNPSFGSGAW
jgi:hypothetical protein